MYTNNDENHHDFLIKIRISISSDKESKNCGFKTVMNQSVSHSNEYTVWGGYDSRTKSTFTPTNRRPLRSYRILFNRLSKSLYLG